MGNYNSEQIQKQIKQIMDTEYEMMYPYELEKSLSGLLKITQDNKDEKVITEILWEFDLLNRTFGHSVDHNGEEIKEISNKWKNILDEGSLKPFSNPPFCEWKKEAVDYYKRRYGETESGLSKARYAYAILVFSSGKDRIEWFKKSVKEWLKTAEKYVADGVYNQKYYEIPPFAYEFTLKMSFSFGQKEIAKTVLVSLHKSIINILESGEKRWYLEFLEVESKYINQFDNTTEIKKESTSRIKLIIKTLEKDFKQSTDKQKSNHLLRKHIQILLNYNTEDEYFLNEMIAESYIKEADARKEPLVKSTFYNDAIKKYKSMQSSYPDKKETIEKRIQELILKIKEVSSKVKYKEFQTKFEITKEQIGQYLSQLKSIGGDIYDTFLDDSDLFPKYNETYKMTVEQKKQYPLQFIIPITIYNAEEPVMKIVNEEQIFDYKVRSNILMGLKIGEIMCKITFETLNKEFCSFSPDKIDDLLNQEELNDIKPALKIGFNFIFGKQIDYIAGLHILIPYVEEILRLIMKKAGKVDVILEQHKTKFFRGIELGGLLNDKNVESIIGLDFQKSLKVLLVDNDQANLRNDLLHGRLSSDKIEKRETIFVAYCLLKLIKILKDLEIKTK